MLLNLLLSYCPLKKVLLLSDAFCGDNNITAYLTFMDVSPLTNPKSTTNRPSFLYNEIVPIIFRFSALISQIFVKLT